MFILAEEKRGVNMGRRDIDFAKYTIQACKGLCNNYQRERGM